MRIRHLLLFVISVFVAEIVLSMSIMPIPYNYDAQALMDGIKHVSKVDVMIMIINSIATQMLW